MAPGNQSVNVCDEPVLSEPETLPPSGPQPKIFAVAYSFAPMNGSGAIRNNKILEAVAASGCPLRVLTVKGEGAEKTPTNMEVIRTSCIYTNDVLVGIKNFVTLKWLRKWFKKSTKSTGEKPAAKADASEAPVGRPTGLKAMVTNWVSIPDKYVGWIPFGVWAGIRSLRKEPADVIYAVGKPWSGFFIGYALKVFFGKPLVIDLMDPWMASTWRSSRGIVVGRLDRFLEKFIVRRADYIVANTAELRQDFLDRLGVPDDRVGVITCGYDPRVIDAAGTEQMPRSERFTITHTGTFYKKRTPLHFVMALKKLFDAGAIPADGIAVKFIGRLNTREPELMELLKDPQIAAAVHREDWVPHADAIRHMQSSDALLLVQPDTQLQIPAKLYEYAYIGRPILALVDAGGAADNLIRNEGWGTTIAYNDVDAIAEALREMYEAHRDGRLGESAHAEHAEAYSYASLGGRLIEMCDSTRPAAQRT